MKNITLKIDDETYHRARVRAAERGTSVSAMVREFLVSQATDEEAAEARRVAALDEIYGVAEEGGRTRTEPLQPLTRDEIYGSRFP